VTDPRPVHFTPVEVQAAIDDHMAWYVEHWQPEPRPARLPDSIFDPAVEKLLRLDPDMSKAEALHVGCQLGFSVGVRLASPHRDLDGDA
jgi:hypothetical protein